MFDVWNIRNKESGQVKVEEYYVKVEVGPGGWKDVGGQMVRSIRNNYRAPHEKHGKYRASSVLRTRRRMKIQIIF